MMKEHILYDAVIHNGLFIESIKKIQLENEQLKEELKIRM